MSEQIKHECGIAFLRLRKPLDYFVGKYGNALWPLDKMYLLMEKQHNRGQDGAGIATVKFDMQAGEKYINIARSAADQPIKDLFSQVYGPIKTSIPDKKLIADVDWMKKHIEFVGELYLGHLRYGTFGKNSMDTVHPFFRSNNWATRNLVIAGNFNLTNVDELNGKLISLGQHPVQTSDTAVLLEKIGKFLDDENQELFEEYKAKNYENIEISKLIAKNIDIQRILKKSSKYWDGGYVICGLMGHGDSFITRDPAGIRPAYYYIDDEIVSVASERAALMTVFNVNFEDVKELQPGEVLVVKRDGSYEFKEVKPANKELTPCSFERIYFSRGTDAEIYKERKKLGALLARKVLQAVDYNFKDTVFSYIPNTAQVAFRGMSTEINNICREIQRDKILTFGNNITKEALDEVFTIIPRVENVAVKDVKLRTFIAEDAGRNDLVEHVYDVTYGVVRDFTDTLVVVDDSIVRGTTLKQTILRILDRLNPKEIIIVSSAPQIRYPDCYGIDMSNIGALVAFQAAIALLNETGQADIINQVYKKCKQDQDKPKEEVVNHVREIYKPFTPEQITQKITELLTPEDVRANVKIIYQSIEDLHKACPNNHGDWYFTGKYPTPGGNKIAINSFIKYIEKNK